MADEEDGGLANESGANNVQFALNSKHVLKKNKGRAVYKVLVVISGSLVSLSFGMMLGWPSPNYPTLLGDDSPIPITLDQSAMVAGMLMNGFVIATPLTGRGCIHYKPAIISASAIMLTGWLVMAGTRDVLGLCISRLLVGAAAGFGIGTYKTEVANICDAPDAAFCKNLTVGMIGLGVCVTFVVGSLVTFRTLPVIASVLLVVGFMCMIPARKNTDVLKPLEAKHNKWKARTLVMLFWFVILQQFSGGPPLIVYSQIIFAELNCPFPSACAAVYAFFFLISSLVGLRYTPKLKPITVMLISYSATAVISALHALYLWYKPDVPYLYLVVSMLAYCVFHTAGVASVMGPLLSDLYPRGVPKFVEKFVIMCTAELAVIITKVFQVLYGRNGMCVSFCLLLATSLTGVLTAAVCSAQTKSNLETDDVA